MLEGSKDFAKDFMNKYDIPTARHFTATSTNIKKGIDFLKSLEPPYVLKADGLAAGKGVLILDNLEIAEKELKNILSGKFGNAGEKVVIEEFLSGIELSVFVLTDGKHYLILPEAKDYKRIGENDTGPNTGGMGSVSPVSFANKEFMTKVENRIIKPTIAGLIKEKIHYQGFIFFGLIKVNNDPYVIEYNCRMGDPETESVFPRIKNDFVELLEGVVSQTLDKMNIETDPRFVSSIMLVSGGYPDSYEKGFPISGLETTENCIVFHAGTGYSENTVITNGGRVMAITCYGNSMKESLEKGLKNAEKINFSGKYFRRDIGFDLGKHN
jgi:phosphoribosylamine---glycine ligase